MCWLAVSCAKNAKKVSKPFPSNSKLNAAITRPLWYLEAERISPQDFSESTPLHPFYDFPPFIDYDKLKVNAYITTLSGSKAFYLSDLRTGRRYMHHALCSTRDSWNKYSWSFESIGFHLGVVPRMLDNTGRPQKIAIFGDREYFNELDSNRPDQKSYRLKVVGGLIEQQCMHYPCRLNSDWTSRVVLLGVNTFDPAFEKVNSIETLREAINWDAFLAQIQNMQGKHLLSDGPRAAFRVVNTLGPSRALNSMKKFGKELAFKDLKMH